MAVEADEEVFGGSDVGVAGVEFLEHFVDQEEHVDEHGYLHNAAQHQQGTVRDKQAFGHAGADNLIHRGALHELAQRVGRQAQHAAGFFGDGRSHPRGAGEAGNFTELVARSTTADDAEAAVFLSFDDDAALQDEERGIVLIALAQEHIAGG